VELAGQAESFRKRGIGVASVIPEPVATIKEFVTKHGLDYPVLSDADAAIIRRFGIVDRTFKATGDLAGKDIPYAGTFLVDEHGTIKEKFFEQAAENRRTTASILVLQGEPGTGGQEIRAGHFTLRTSASNAEVAPGQLTHQIRESVENAGVRFVVIDSLNGFLNAMPEESFLVLQLHELLAFLGRKGVVTILVVAQNGLVGSMVSPIDVTYLADTVLLLRHFEAGGELHRAISVLKKRTGGHESTIRELHFGRNGLTAGEPLHQFRGVLTGVPTFVSTAAELTDSGGRRRD